MISEFYACEDMMECKHQTVGKTKDGKLYLHPCGQCTACRINDGRAWFVRSHFETKKLERPFQYFLTLTYDEDNLPDDGLCHKDELKKFLNNLNTSFGLSMRYYATADYGSINNRAHYHAVILSTKKVTQKQVERIWKKGFVMIKELNEQNLKYVLRYTVKKKPFDSSEPGYFRLISKGWGNNVGSYYHEGQEYFTINGKRYGITRYLREKLHLDKNPLVTYFDNRDLIFSKNYEKVDNFEKHRDDVIKLNIMRRKLK